MSEGWPNPDAARIDEFSGKNQGKWDCLQLESSFEEYFRKVALPQVKELLDKYSDVAVFWWDTPMSIPYELALELKAEIDKYPLIITNDRLRVPNIPGDYKTPEGLVPKAEDIEGIDWETCMNIGSSWGYKSWENQWKSPETIIRNLITIAARGGNYLLNVGPDAEGRIPEEAVARLDQLGNWMSIYGESIYGTTLSLFTMHCLSSPRTPFYSNASLSNWRKISISIKRIYTPPSPSCANKIDPNSTNLTSRGFEIEYFMG